MNLLRIPMFWRVSLAVVALTILLPLRGFSTNWPQSIETDEGKVVVYTPQVDALDGDALKGRVAVSVATGDRNEPVFGAVWFSCRAVIDREKRTVTFQKLKVERTKFQDATPEQTDSLGKLLGEKLPASEMIIPLDTLVNQLDLAKEKQQQEAKLDNTAPEIVFSDKPTVHVSLDGEPKMTKVEGTDLEKMTNTPYFIVFDPADRVYYLKGGDIWYSATEYAGPWNPGATPPTSVEELASIDFVTTPTGMEGGTTPDILVTTKPAELVQTSGEPNFVELKDTKLQYADNSNRDWLYDTEGKKNYVLLAGRWYASGSKDGPWEHVAPKDLPKDFTSIPKDSAVANVRASVAGTEEAAEAVASLEVPQTTAVKRDEAKFESTYDGEPEFKPIEGTKMAYATNTDQSIVRTSDNKYFACEDGVWYCSEAAVGPWILADSVPNEIYTIPPSCPIYNVTFVRVYDSTEEEVYCGYTPGYVGSYYSGGTVVYGTGYHYGGWCGSCCCHAYPATWGLGVSYNPWCDDWGFSVGWGPGWIGWGCGLHCGWFGPIGWCDYDIDIHVHHHDWHGWHHDGHWDGHHPHGDRPWGNHVYAKRGEFKRGDFDRSRGTVLSKRTGEWKGKLDRSIAKSGGALPGTRLASRQLSARDGGLRTESLRAGRTGRDGRLRDDVIADKDGNIFRKTDKGGLQKREGGKWSDVKDTGAKGKLAGTRDEGRRGREDTDSGRRSGERDTARDRDVSRDRDRDRDVSSDTGDRQRGRTRDDSGRDSGRLSDRSDSDRGSGVDREFSARERARDRSQQTMQGQRQSYGDRGSGRGSQMGSRSGGSRGYESGGRSGGRSSGGNRSGARSGGRSR